MALLLQGEDNIFIFISVGLQADDERPGNLEYKHSKVLQSQDASAIGFSYTTKNSVY